MLYLQIYASTPQQPSRTRKCRILRIQQAVLHPQTLRASQLTQATWTRAQLRRRPRACRQSCPAIASILCHSTRQSHSPIRPVRRDRSTTMPRRLQAQPATTLLQSNLSLAQWPADPQVQLQSPQVLTRTAAPITPIRRRLLRPFSITIADCTSQITPNIFTTLIINSQTSIYSL